MKLFDSHVHLNDRKFDEDRQSVIDALPHHNIAKIINVGADMETSSQSVAMADDNDMIYASVGIHPHDAKLFTQENIDELRQMIENKKVVAIGEIGLDYHYDFSPRDIQMDVFRRQLSLAKEVNLPVIYHVREAFGDFIPMVQNGETVNNAVMHCYGGSVESAKICLDAGMHISFTGVITFKNANKIKKVVEYVPMDRMLIETDCPYMAPVPHRGKRNEPKYVMHVAEAVAQIKGLTLDNVADITYNNTLRLFNIKD